MAAKTLRLSTTLDNSFRQLIEADQTLASETDGWTVAKVTSANDSEYLVGTKRASGTFSTEAGTPKPGVLATGASANAFKSQNAYTGIFAAAAWTLTFAVRATVASSQAGRCRLRVFKSVNADGSGATELTGSTQVGTTSSALSTSADVTTVVTWTPAAAITMNNEYLFFVIAWEITTASGSNTGDVVFRTGTSSAGTRIVTSNLAPAVTSASVSSTSAMSGSVVALKRATPAAVNATSAASASLIRVKPVTPAAITATSSVTATAPYSTTVLATTGLVSYWRLAESSGTNAADQLSAHAGTYVAAPTLAQTGLLTNDVDTAVKFTLDTQWISLATPPIVYGLAQSTFECWLKTVTPHDGLYQQIYNEFSAAHNGRWRVQMTGGGPLGFDFIGDDGVEWAFDTGATVVDDGAIHHVVVAFDSGNVTIYIDGVVRGSRSGSAAARTQTDIVGRIAGFSGANTFKGWLDEVAVYNVALSAATVLSHYRSGSLGSAVRAFTPGGVISPAAITSTSAMSGTVTGLKRVTPAAISSNSAVSGVAVALRAVKPAALSSTSTVTGSVQALKRFAPGAINATSTIGAAIVRLRPVVPAGVNATSAMSATVQARKRLTPAAISSTSPLAASVVRLSAVTPGSVTATSTVTAAVVKLAAVRPASVISSSTISGAVVALRAITPSAINATSSTSASIIALRHLAASAITATSSASATVTRRAAIKPSAINATATVSATVTKIGAGTTPILPATITSTSSISGALVILHTAGGGIGGGGISAYLLHHPRRIPLPECDPGDEECLRLRRLLDEAQKPLIAASESAATPVPPRHPVRSRTTIDDDELLELMLLNLV